MTIWQKITEYVLGRCPCGGNIRAWDDRRDFCDRCNRPPSWQRK